MKNLNKTMPTAVIAVLVSALMLVGPVFAQPTITAEWEETGTDTYTVPPNTDMVTSIMVANDGDDAENIQIVADIDDFDPVSEVAQGEYFWTDSIGRDNEWDTANVEVAAGEENYIALSQDNVMEVLEITFDEDVPAENYTYEVVENQEGITVSNVGGENFTVEDVNYTFLDEGQRNNLVSNDNIVLPAGTEVNVDDDDVTVFAVENTPLIVPEDTLIKRDPIEGDNWLTEDDETLVVDNENIEFDDLVGENDKITNLEEQTVENDDGFTLRLAEDTKVIEAENESFTLPETTSFELADNYGVEMGQAGDNIEVAQDVWDNSHSVLDKDEMLRATYGFDVVGEEDADLGRVRAGDTISYDNVVAPEGTALELGDAVNVTLPEDTTVERGADNQVEIVDLDAAVGQPEGWDATAYDDKEHYVHGDVNYIEWVTEDYPLESGEELEFPVALTTPDEPVTVRIRAYDEDGRKNVQSITLDVDDEDPEVDELNVDPEWAGENEEVSIDLDLTKDVVEAPDVAVKENNGEWINAELVENVNDQTFEYIYEVGDNIERDGIATIVVENYEDEVGNEGLHHKWGPDERDVDVDEDENVLFINRIAPPAPELGDITDWPEDMLDDLENTQTNVVDYFLEESAVDNFAGDATYPLAYGTVEILVDGTWNEVEADSDGYWQFDEEFPEGEYEIGARYTDRAGNVGEENTEMITADATAPSVDMVAPEDEAWINDDQPTIELTIEDEVMGIENNVVTVEEIDFPVYADAAEDKAGYQVMLTTPEWGEALVEDEDEPEDNMTIIADGDEENVPMILLSNEQAWDRHQIDFSNSLEDVVVMKEDEEDPYVADEVTLEDDEYAVAVMAGDQLQETVESFEFTLDTEPIDASRYEFDTFEEEAEAVDLRNEEGVGLAHDVHYSTEDVRFKGESQKPYSTITIMFNGEVQATTESDEHGEWEITLEGVDEGIHTVVIQEEDRAGNSDSAEWGTLVKDRTAPTIEFDEATAALDGEEIEDHAVVIEGTVEDEIAESDEIEVQISAPGEANPILFEGAFADSVSLVEGPNTIIVAANDPAGNLSTARLTVTRTVDDWAMWATIAAIIAIILAALAIIRRQ